MVVRRQAHVPYLGEIAVDILALLEDRVGLVLLLADLSGGGMDGRLRRCLVDALIRRLPRLVKQEGLEELLNSGVEPVTVAAIMRDLATGDEEGLAAVMEAGGVNWAARVIGGVPAAAAACCDVLVAAQQVLPPLYEECGYERIALLMVGAGQVGLAGRLAALGRPPSLMLMERIIEGFEGADFCSKEMVLAALRPVCSAGYYPELLAGLEGRCDIEVPPSPLPVLGGEE